VSVPPTCTGSGAADFVSSRSAFGSGLFTVVAAEAELFVVSGSVSLAVTLAAFVTDAASVGLTTIVTVADPPEAIVPSLQMTVPEAWEQPLPCDETAEPKATAPGSVSVTATSVAALGPRFCTVSVNVSGLPTATGSGAAFIVSAVSATGSTVVVVVAELFPESGSAVALDAVAVFEIAPGVCGATTIVTVASAPGASVPRSHPTVPELWTQRAGEAETKVTLPGNGSVTVTPAAALGPALWTVSV